MPEHVPPTRYFDAADELVAIVGVSAAEVALDRPDLDQPCIEVSVPLESRVPPRVHRAIAELDLGTRPDLGGRRPGEFVMVVV